MHWTATDIRFMSQALQLARNGIYTCDPNPRTGCVLVRDSQIIGSGYHRRSGEAHAEINALRQAGNASGSTCYVTLEPCCHHGRTAPCTEALIAAGVNCVHAAMHDPNPQVNGQGIAQLQQAGITVSCGLLSEQAEQINPGFISRMQRQRPWVRLKVASSLDGRSALANGNSQWLTGVAARRDVHRLRAEHAAIITGIGTVLADDPALTVRDFAADFEPPLRVILDTHLRTPPSAQILRGGNTLLYTSTDDDNRIQALRTTGTRIQQLPKDKSNHIDLHACLQHLAKDEQRNTVLVEAGGTLAGAFIQSGLVDELILYLSASLLGHQSQAILKLNEALHLHECPQLKITDVRHVGTDLRITARTTSAQA